MFQSTAIITKRPFCIALCDSAGTFGDQTSSIITQSNTKTVLVCTGVVV